MRAEPADPPSLNDRVHQQVDRVRKYANWTQYTAVAILIITLVALTVGMVSQTLRLDWWIVIVLAFILAASLGVATLARRLAIFAHLIVRVFSK